MRPVQPEREDQFVTLPGRIAARDFGTSFGPFAKCGRRAMLYVELREITRGELRPAGLGKVSERR
jgi:hypothetical protein